MRQPRLKYILGSESRNTSSPARTKSVSSDNRSQSNGNLADLEKIAKKDKTTLSRLKRTFSNRGQKIMEKISTSNLKRSTSRELLCKLQHSPRGVSRSATNLSSL